MDSKREKNQSRVIKDSKKRGPFVCIDGILETKMRQMVHCHWIDICVLVYLNHTPQNT